MLHLKEENTRLDWLFSPNEKIFKLQDLPDNAPNVTPAQPSASNKVIITLFKTTTEHLPEADSVLLDNMLKAVRDRLPAGNTLSELPRINLQYTPYTFAQLHHIYQPSYVIGFGIRRTDVAMNVQANLYETFELLDTQMFFAEQLSLYHSNKDKKTKMWNGLQQLFGIAK